MSAGMHQVIDAVALVLLSAGVLLLIIAAIGLLRLPDVLSRMHAATKPQLAGLILMLTGLALELRAWAPLGLLFIALLAQVLTAPVAAHFVGRSAYRTGQYRDDLLARDEQNETAMRRSTAAAGYFGPSGREAVPRVHAKGPVVQLSRDERAVTGAVAGAVPEAGSARTESAERGPAKTAPDETTPA